MADYDVIVIGAGCGGVTAGALLAHQGRSVLLLEQSDRVGGCCSTFERDGYHFDSGASIVEVIKAIELAFEALGTTFHDEVDLIPVDPVMTGIYPDGSQVSLPLSLDGTAEVLAAIDPGSVQGWRDYCAFMGELVDVALNTFFVQPADTLADLVAMVRRDRRLLRFLPTFLSSYQDTIQRFFKNERVLELMGYQSLYFGLPPALVPGPFAMIPYTEHLGVYYPRGGMGQIPAAFVRCGRARGMELRLNSLVSKVLVEKGRARGVRLADGSEITAKVIVSNINARTLYQRLIGEAHLPWLARRGIASYTYSKAVPMIYLGLDAAPPLESHHSLVTVSPDGVNDYWWHNVQTGRLPEKNIGLICWPTCSDPSLAPAGHHVINLIPEGFYHLAGTDWDAEKPRFLERSIDYFDRQLIPGVKDHITLAECASPLDYERQLLLPEGAIYAFQQDLTAMAVLRPAARSKSIDGLYLTGASTHPGGGVPTTVASGLIAAGLIERFEQ